MGKEEKRVLTLDKYEHGVVVNALNEMRNDLLEEPLPRRGEARAAQFARTR